jgi:hypothetical protein
MAIERSPEASAGRSLYIATIGRLAPEQYETLVPFEIDVLDGIHAVIALREVAESLLNDDSRAILEDIAGRLDRAIKKSL